MLILAHFLTNDFLLSICMCVYAFTCILIIIFSLNFFFWFLAMIFPVFNFYSFFCDYVGKICLQISKVCLPKFQAISNDFLDCCRSFCHPPLSHGLACKIPFFRTFYSHVSISHISFVEFYRYFCYFYNLYNSAKFRVFPVNKSCFLFFLNLPFI